MTDAARVQGGSPRVGFIGWGTESARAWHAFSAVEDAVCWLPPDSDTAPQLPPALRRVGSIEAVFTAAQWLFVEGDPAALSQALHTMRLAMTDRHILAALGPQWRIGALLEQLHERKVLRCMLLSAGHGTAVDEQQADSGVHSAFSAIALHAAPPVGVDERVAFRALFHDPQQVVELREEAQFDVMQALGGFAPAAFLTVLDSMADGVRMLGVPRGDAVRLLAALLLDEVATVLSGQRTVAELREHALGQDVAAAGLMELEVAGLRGHMMRAVHEAVRHAREQVRRKAT